jgi:hypothetical protein
MPNGTPRWIRVYDNGGVDAKNGSLDRYTVVFTGRYSKRVPGQGSWFQHVALSSDPHHPHGFCQHGENQYQPIDTLGKKPGWHWPPAVGRKNHLGRRIRFSDLPRDCQRVVIEDYKEIWGIKLTSDALTIK